MYKVVHSLIFTAIIGLPPVSHAAFINQGDYAVDDTTDLYWLNLSHTVGLSYSEVTGLLASGGSLDGWRYATYDEVTSLWTSLVPGFIDGESKEENNGLTSLIADGIGYSYTDYGTDFDVAGVRAMHFKEIGGDSTTYGILDDVIAAYLPGNDALLGRDYVQSRIINDIENQDPWIASYLVRDNTPSVPLPSTLLLFLSALPVLGTFIKRSGIS